MAENVPVQDLESYYTTFNFPDDYVIDIEQLLQHVYQQMLTHHFYADYAIRFEVSNMFQHCPVRALRLRALASTESFGKLRVTNGTP